MAFPFLAAAGLGLQAAGTAGQLFSLFSGTNGSGRVQRALAQGIQAGQAGLATQAQAKQYALAAGDITNPLFRQTVALEQSRLQRAISEGIQAASVAERRGRARGLSAGVRPERLDENRNRAITQAFAAASEQANTAAQQRLLATADQLRTIGAAQAGTGDVFGKNAYYGAIGGATTDLLRQQRVQDLFAIPAAYGSQLGEPDPKSNLGQLLEYAGLTGNPGVSFGAQTLTPSLAQPRGLIDFSWR